MKKIIESADAPEAIGPYSQAVVFNGTVYCSGQIALDPQTLEMAGSDVRTQTRQVMVNLEKVLMAAGSDLSQILKCTIYLTAMEDFQACNEIYSSYFETDPPARETVAVKELPRAARVEISCIAALKDAG